MTAWTGDEERQSRWATRVDLDHPTAALVEWLVIFALAVVFLLAIAEAWT